MVEVDLELAPQVPELEAAAPSTAPTLHRLMPWGMAQARRPPCLLSIAAHEEREREEGSARVDKMWILG
jgi:hypothetical protein